jgi:hypothetical protein
MAYLPTLIIAIVLLTMGACQAPATTEVPAPQAEENPLVGTWLQEHSRGDDFYLQLSPDGTFAASHIYNDLEIFPRMKGTFQIDDAVLTIKVDPEETLVCDGKTGQFTITEVDADQIFLQELDWEECHDFGLLTITTLPWIRYSPEE